MLHGLFGEKKEGVCPNCGTACAATDIYCPACRLNLDELYEQLPDNWSAERQLPRLGAEPRLLLGWVAGTAWLLFDYVVATAAVLIVSRTGGAASSAVDFLNPWATVGAARLYLSAAQVGDVFYLVISNCIFAAAYCKFGKVRRSQTSEH